MGATYIALKRLSESIFLGTPKANTHEFSHPLPFPAFLLPTNSKLTRIHTLLHSIYLVNFCDETNLKSKGDKNQVFTHRSQIHITICKALISAYYMKLQFFKELTFSSLK
jgi:hypothetical protein